MRKKIVGVIGGHACSREVEQSAHQLGKKLAKVADILVCGGLGGVMKAVCSGFKAGGGLTLGIITSYDRQDANEYCDIVIPSGLGYARNVLVVQTGELIVALPGEYGTLSEVAFALQFKKPIISLSSWDIPGVIKVKTVDEAAEKVKSILNKI